MNINSNSLLHFSYNISDIDPEKWNSLLENSKYCNFFQTPEYFIFIRKVKGHKPFILILEENNEYQISILGDIIYSPGIIKVITKRAIIEGGIVINDKCTRTDEFIRKALNFLNFKLQHLVIYVEIRNLNSYEILRNSFKESQFLYKEHLNILVDCRDLNELKIKMSSSRLRQINKAINNNSIILEANSEEEVKQFYKILREIYLKKVKKPLPDFSFFKSFFEDNLGKYFLVKYNDMIIGGTMCPIYKKRFIYEWYIAGKDEQFKTQYPSVLATWAAIQYAHKNKIATFDFFGAGKPNEDYGVRDFKKRFGGEQIEFGRFLKINFKLIYFFGELYFKIRK
jgi:serine/alanine adding enzyme